ncbi:hypothetical protein [Shewanella sp. 1180_01]|uniref:hypothetical protein n=1 Tax=Shewanella sp. 1180_01 TaxID=2604451 RepID=UPI004063F81F
MIQLIVGFFILCLALFVLKKCFSIIKYLLGIILGLGIFALCGVQAGVSYAVERMFNTLKINNVMFYLFCIFSIFTSVYIGFFWDGGYFDLLTFSSLKYLAISAAYIAVAVKLRNFEEISKKLYGIEFFLSKRKEIYFSLYFSIFTAAISFFIYDIAYYLSVAVGFYVDSQVVWYVGLVYWLISLFASAYAFGSIYELDSLYSNIESSFDDFDVIYIDKLVVDLKGDSNSIDDIDIIHVVKDYVALGVLEGNLFDLELANKNVAVFRKDDFESRNRVFEGVIDAGFAFNKDELVKIVIDVFSFEKNNAIYYVENDLKTAGLYNFNDGRKYFSYRNVSRVKTCSCCGFTVESGEPITQEWFCSDICKETEKFCLGIKNKPYDEFLSSAASSGFIIMSGAQAWNDNHKIFADGGQGHGFAAENANTYIDKLSGKSASTIGGDNKKDGADRFVNGELLQTKYCATGRRSVNAAFHGDGDYRYLDDNGRPMLLEVPKEQYDDAVRTFAEKIKQGKVPGVTDPEKAKDIISKGNITYDQARNITKFGTIESISYDLAEGVVVGFKSASISFGITAAIYFINTRDKNQAIKVATLQAGKTFSRSLSIYVTVQQLHRLSSVQRTLGVIDVSNLSPSCRTILGDGFGVSSTSGINKALRGTVITSAVLIAVSTGPDLVKMIRGRISGAQFLKNAAVVSSSVVGGTIGSIAGGALFSPFGPAGMVAGRVVGGMVGGTVSAFIVNKVSGKFMEADSQKMLKVVKDQFEYLATTFMFTREEVDNVNQNLEKIITPVFLENMYANYENRYAIANLGMKPLFVSVIKQRKKLSIETKNVIQAIDELAA